MIEDNGGQCTAKGFYRRMLYKLSGLKVFGFLLSIFAIFGVLAVGRFWKGLQDVVLLKALGAIEAIAIALFAVRGVQNVAGEVGSCFKSRNGSAVGGESARIGRSDKES